MYHDAYETYILTVTSPLRLLAAVPPACHHWCRDLNLKAGAVRLADHGDASEPPTPLEIREAKRVFAPDAPKRTGLPPARLAELRAAFFDPEPENLLDPLLTDVLLQLMVFGRVAHPHDDDEATAATPEARAAPATFANVGRNEVFWFTQGPLAERAFMLVCVDDPTEEVVFAELESERVLTEYALAEAQCPGATDLDTLAGQPVVIEARRRS